MKFVHIILYTVSDIALYLTTSLAEGMGFEPMRGFSPPNRLAGGRTRPLCDPSL